MQTDFKFAEKQHTPANGLAHSPTDLLADAFAKKTTSPAVAEMLAHPEVKSALAAAYNQVPAWLKIVLAIVAAIGLGPLLAAYVNAQALWSLPTKYETEITAIKTEQAAQGKQIKHLDEQLDRIEGAIEQIANKKEGQ